MYSACIHGKPGVVVIQQEPHRVQMRSTLNSDIGHAEAASDILRKDIVALLFVAEQGDYTLRFI